jgi:hypothetical protein
MDFTPQQFHTAIHKAYEVSDDCIIRSPGKFEGESCLAVYLYQCFVFADNQDQDIADILPAFRRGRP